MTDAEAVLALTRQAQEVADKLECAEIRAALLRAELTGLANFATESGLFDIGDDAGEVLGRPPMTGETAALILSRCVADQASA